MELGVKWWSCASEEIQEAPEKRMGRQRKPAVDMSGKEHALTVAGLRFDLSPREMRGGE